MAKGQKRSNRELKKPKASKKPEAGAVASQYQLPVKTAASKSGGK
jgi:hypothetical protein